MHIYFNYLFIFSQFEGSFDEFPAVHHVYKNFSGDGAQHVQSKVNYFPLFLSKGTFIDFLLVLLLHYSERISDEGLGRSVHVDSASSNISMRSFCKYIDIIIIHSLQTNLRYKNTIKINPFSSSIRYILYEERNLNKRFIPFTLLWPYLFLSTPFD